MRTTCRTHVVRWQVLALLIATAVALPLTGHDIGAAPGNLDPSFKDGGRVTTAVPTGDGRNSLAALALQGDGRIVAVGSTGNGDWSNYALIRYMPDGTRDRSFGVGGIVHNVDDRGSAFDVAIRPDGRIAVGGDWLVSTPPVEWRSAVVQFNPDGTRDTTFGVDGVAATEVPDQMSWAGVQIALQSDGAIVLAGLSVDVDETGRDFALTRVTADGVIDRSFGDNGQVRTHFAGMFEKDLTDIALQDDGRIVAVGYGATHQYGLWGDFLVARYMPDGSLDPSFGVGGQVIMDIHNDTGRALGVAIQADGKIVQVGHARHTEPPGTTIQNIDFYLVRYNTDGSLDTSFDSDGKVITDLGGSESRGDIAYRVAIDSIGRIVVAGTTSVSSATRDDMALARYNADGSLDTSFGTGGWTATDFLSAEQSAEALLLQPDGKIVMGGRTWGSGPPSPDPISYFSLARLDGGIPHASPFFLHGGDAAPGTGALTMRPAAPPSEPLTVDAPSVTWLSDPPVNGTFPAYTTFRLVTPCTQASALGKTVQLASTDLDGDDDQPLGTGTTPSGQPCGRTEVITIPIITPVTLTNRRLKLTVSGPGGVHLQLGPRTFVSATAFEAQP